jgi:hypothetical protein
VAHEIDQTTGRAAVFVTGEPAWHRLGTVIEQATTSAEAIGLAGLDWRVEQWPVRAFDPDNNTTEAGIPDKVANVRIDDEREIRDIADRLYRGADWNWARGSPASTWHVCTTTSVRRRAKRLCSSH